VKRFALPAVVIVAMALTGCASSPKAQFFALTPTEGQQVNAVGVGVHIEVVHVPPALDDQKIIRESATGKVKASDRNRWAAPLDEMMRQILTQDLSQRMPPGSVLLPEQPAPAGTRRIVLDILHFASDASGNVALTGGWSLLPPESDTPLLNKRVQLSETADPSDYASQVVAMSRVLGHLADGMARELSILGNNDASSVMR
jgi:uncharacterized lipoprotein YmbA